MENLWQNSLSCGHRALNKSLEMWISPKGLFLMATLRCSQVNCSLAEPGQQWIVWYLMSSAGKQVTLKHFEPKKKKLSPRQAICRGIPRSYEIISITSFHSCSRFIHFYQFCTNLLSLLKLYYPFFFFYLSPTLPCIDLKLNSLRYISMFS